MGVIHEELIKTRINAKDSKGVLTEMAGLLRKYNYVKESFTDAVVKREKIFPTGLNLPTGINIAIPHTDACHVNKPAIAIGVLSTPVQFKSMATKIDDLDVSLVVMLAVKDPGKQVETLRRAMEFFQEEEAIRKIMNSKTEKEVFDIAVKYFDFEKA